MPHISESAPLQISRFYTGWYTYRNPTIVPIRQVGRRIIELYDAISDGLNMECTNRLTLARRPGYTAVNSNWIPSNGVAQYFYSFKPSSFPGQINQVVDSTTAVFSFQPDAIPSQVWTGLVPKLSPALTNFATVGAYCYMSHETFAQKWDGPAGPQQVTQWGIDMYNTGQTQGGNFPTAIADLPGSGPNWVPVIAGQLYNVALNPATPFSQWIKHYGYGFTFNFSGFNPEVSGIKVIISMGVSPQVSGTSFNVRLLRNGAQYGVQRTITGPVSNIITLGGPSDTWDADWTFHDIDQATFGVAIQAINSSASDVTFTISAAEMFIYVNYPVLANSTAPPAGPTRTTQFGYFYKYAYGNSHSGHVSSPTPPSIGNTPDGLIDPGTNAVQVTVISSPDPQVDCIHIYRTTDGGANPYYELPNSPIPNPAPGTLVSLVDYADDTQLQINSVCPDPYYNNPPPGGAIDPVWFAGRLWLHRGNQLFFSSGPDTNAGNEAECWYPVYVFAVPTEIIRKFATPNGLLLICLDEILIVRGISTASFTVNDYARDTGIRAWTACDTDGTNVYLYTSDRQFLLINANGFTSIGGSVADRIATVDPTQAYVCQYRYGAFENLLFLGDGSTTLYPYNVELQAWNTPQQPIGGVGAISTVETSPGIYQFWRAQPAVQSTVTFRDLTSLIDEGIPYPCTVTFGPIPVADYTTLAQIRDIVFDRSTTTSQVIFSAMANEISPIAGKQFQILQKSSNEPPELDAVDTVSLSHICERYTWKSTPLPELVNLLFMRLDFSADPNLDELFVWTIAGTQTTGGSSLGQPGQLPQLQGR